MSARGRSSPLAAWWREVDRVALTAMAGLLAAGLLCSLAASPAAAERLGVDDPFRFLTRHAVYASVALALVLGVSMLGPTAARRAAVLALIASMGLLVLTLLIGAEVNGARRWLRLGGLSLQPVERSSPSRRSSSRRHGCSPKGAARAPARPRRSPRASSSR